MSQRVRGLLDRLLARRRTDAGDGIPDSELLRRFAHTGDEAAFELLVWRHGAMVLGLCRRAIRDEQLAEDAFQAVFLVLARKAASVRGNLGGWLFKVARRVTQRANARRPVASPVPEIAENALPDPLEQGELAQLLDAEVARLPERLRKPVVLCYLGGQSTEDAARELGCPRGTVLSRLASARARLAERLTRRGVTLPAILAAGGGAALPPRIVSATLLSARQFALGSGPLTTPMMLAHGVNHAMNRTTLLTALGGAVLALALASGLGLVVAQNGPPAAVADGESRVTAAPPVAPPAPNAPPARDTKPDPNAARRDADEKIVALEKLRAVLQLEIDLQEKAIEVVARNANTGESSLTTLQKRFADTEALLSATQRELDKLAAETKVLKKRIEDKNVGTPDPAAIAEAVAKDPAVVTTTRELTATKQYLDVELKRAQPNNPHVQELQTKVAALEKERDRYRNEAAAKAHEAAKAAQTAAYRKRLDELAIQAEVKQEERESVLRERDAVKKALANTPGQVTNIEALQKALEPQREMLAKVQRQLILIRLHSNGVILTEPTGTDAKLDAILNELAELRKEVKELKHKR